MDNWSESKKEIAIMLFNSGCIKFGTFVLKSGVESPIYIDLRLIIAFPILLRSIAQEYIHELKKLEFNQIAPLPYAGLPIGTAISLETNTPMLYPRKEVKDYGTKAAIEGVYSKGEKLVIIDDLVTSGNSVNEAIKKLKNEEFEIRDIVVLIDRESGGYERLTNDGYILHSIFKINDLLHYWKKLKLITVDTYLAVTQFLRYERVNSPFGFIAITNDLLNSPSDG